MNTLENNKLIAEFMDWEIVNNQSQLWVDCNPYKGQKPLLLLSYIFEDWNWLMEVVEKIKSLVSLMEIPYTNELIAGLITVNKEAVYNACVEFIKWHNNQNKN